VYLLSNVAATPTTRAIRIALDGAGFHYRAGQAASIGLPGQPLTPYSIASAPYETDESGWLEFLVKVDGSTRFGSQVTGVQPGTPLILTPAIGRFGLPADAAERPLLFVAGGTGIAPLRSMLLDAIHAGRRQATSVVYSARHPEEFAYVDELRALQDAGRIALTLTLTGNAPDWSHARGRAGAAHFEKLVSPDTLCFICGPPAMVAELPQALTGMGVRREAIRTEDW
jgi:ferredoxin-NADP reductase